MYWVDVLPARGMVRKFVPHAHGDSVRRWPFGRGLSQKGGALRKETAQSSQPLPLLHAWGGGMDKGPGRVSSPEQDHTGDLTLDFQP